MALSLTDVPAPNGAISAFLGAAGDPVDEVPLRVEGCYRHADIDAHRLLLSILDTTADYLLLPDEHFPPA